jgi:hypothetical protein
MNFADQRIVRADRVMIGVRRCAEPDGEVLNPVAKRNWFVKGLP